MGYLAWSILCSVSVSVLLKLVPRYGLDIRQAIFVNYLVAGASTWWLLQPNLGNLTHATPATWTVLLLQGMLLPSMFWVLAGAVKYAGVVRTDAAMRLSLLLPLVASFAFFGEVFTGAKGLGIVLGFAAISMLIVRGEASAAQGADRAMLLLAVTFVGMGCIDILFKLIATMQPDASTAVLFAVFTLSAAVAACALAWLYARGDARWKLRHMLAGLALGLLNFGNIYTYIQAHRVMAESPSVVFAAMNIGVIMLATLVGVSVFKERMRWLHAVGIVLAICAVGVLASAS